MSKIVSISTEVPSHKHRQDDIFLFADNIYCRDAADSRKLKFLYNHSGISTRYSVIPDYSLAAEDRQFYSTAKDMEPFPSLEKRMEWYARHAAALSVSAIRKCIEGKIEPSSVTHLITVSCTGMSAPGLDLEIMEAMGLHPNIFRTSVNFMGCYAAIHALKLADAICKNDSTANVVIVCTELCTLHFQKAPTPDNITSTLLFADGSAAALVQHDESVSKGMRLQSFFSEVAFKGKKDMSWQLSSTGFLMTLTGYVPDLINEDFEGLVNRALMKTGLSINDVSHWCIHPGGKKILEVIQRGLSLSQCKLQDAHDVLHEYGNMSSPTVLFVLEKIFARLQQEEAKGQIIFSAAFGPGLTMETFTAVYD